MELESRWQGPAVVWLESMFHVILMPAQLPCLSDVLGVYPWGLLTWKLLGFLSIYIVSLYAAPMMAR